MKKLIFIFLLTSFHVNSEMVLNDPIVGKKAPEFSLNNEFDKKISLLDFAGKYVILEWTNHECPYVKRHYDEKNMQTTQKFAKEHDFIWLSIISSAPGKQGFIDTSTANALMKQRNSHEDHMLFDEKGVVGRLYGAKTTPHMFIIDPEGYLIYKGGIDDIGGGAKFFRTNLKLANNYINSAIENIVNKQNIVSDVTIPYGCSVKY